MAACMSWMIRDRAVTFWFIFLGTCVGGSERPCHDNGDCDGDGTRRGDGKCRCNKGYKGDFCLECDDGYFNKERNDTFSLCTACVGGSERPCHDNGDCDGDGTRRGDGKCRCNKGYKGDFCLECDDGYFNKERNDTFSLCTECHESCQTCSGPTNKDCNECKSGWVQDDEKACNDIDECANETSPCKENQYCHNKEGSYSCKDVNECSLPDKSCLRENEDCVNTKGSFKCVCSQGFEDKDGACITIDETGKPGLLGSGLMLESYVGPIFTTRTQREPITPSSYLLPDPNPQVFVLYLLPVSTDSLSHSHSHTDISTILHRLSLHNKLYSVLAFSSGLDIF
ncbi:UNVERIFIED_CONTAM: hypothetical protein FKN15_033867 [Acipenser sinensis]